MRVEEDLVLCVYEWEREHCIGHRPQPDSGDPRLKDDLDWNKTLDIGTTDYWVCAVLAVLSCVAQLG